MTPQDRAKQVRTLYAERKQAGLCPVCGRQPDQPGKRCLRCREANNRAREAMKQRGGCQVCGQPATSQRCPTCAQKRREQAASNIESGLCYCGRPRSADRRSCSRCLDRGRAKVEALRREAIQAYGGRCACCAEDTDQFLQIDHINGRNLPEGRDRLFGSALYARLRRGGWPSGYQVLCANCNFAKGVFGRCPHAQCRGGSVVAGLGVAVSGN